MFSFFSDVVLYAASANRKYVDNIIKVLADVVLRPRITDDEVMEIIIEYKHFMRNIRILVNYYPITLN